MSTGSTNSEKRGDTSNEKPQRELVNTTPYKGVVPQPNGHWGAQIYTTQNRIWLGTFKTAEDAAKAYDIASMKLRRGNANNVNRNLPWDDQNSEMELEFIDQSAQDLLLDMIKDGNYETKFAEFLQSKAAEAGTTLTSGPCTVQKNEKGCLSQELFRKELTPSDVGKLNRLVIPKRYAQKCFANDKSVTNASLPLVEEDTELSFYDSEMKDWKFRYCYWKSSQSYVFTRGWNKFVKEKDLKANDTVVFYECRTKENDGKDERKFHSIDIVRSKKGEPHDNKSDINSDNNHSKVPSSINDSSTDRMVTSEQASRSCNKVEEAETSQQGEASSSITNANSTNKKGFKLFGVYIS